MTEQFNPEDFKAYLLINKVRSFYTNNACSCPLASWLTYKYGIDEARSVQVRADKVYLPTYAAEDTTLYNTPNWMVRFMEQFDNIEPHPHKGYNYRPPTRSGEVALQMLDVVLKNIKLTERGQQALKDRANEAR